MRACARCLSVLSPHVTKHTHTQPSVIHVPQVFPDNNPNPVSTYLYRLFLHMADDRCLRKAVHTEIWLKGWIKGREPRTHSEESN